MPKPKIVFVIGAGASKEVGLPVGEELIVQICRDMNIRFDFSNSLTSGDPQLAAAVRQRILQGRGATGESESWLHACWRIRDGLKQLPLSIDTYLDTHAADQKMVSCGKLAIAKCISESERRSKLYFDPSNRDSKLNFEAIKHTWFPALQRFLFSGVQPSDIGSALENVTFVVFNYDRCLEHFLYNSMIGYFHVSPSVAKSNMKKVKIWHPYGHIGPLDWTGETGATAFGGRLEMDALLSADERIKLFTERSHNEDELNQVKAAISKADAIAFLGFSYQEQNMALISVPRTKRALRLYGTALQISEFDIPTIEQKAMKSLGGKQPHKKAIFCREWTCQKFFEELHHTLRSIEPISFSGEE
jgi:hypothetical protein